MLSPQIGATLCHAQTALPDNCPVMKGLEYLLFLNDRATHSVKIDNDLRSFAGHFKSYRTSPTLGSISTKAHLSWMGIRKR